MKHLIIAAIGIAAVFATIKLPTHADSSPQQFKHDVVIIRPVDVGYGEQDTNGYVYYHAGMAIESCSSSPGAVTFPNSTVPAKAKPIDLAEATATLMNQGYERVPDTSYWVFVKKYPHR